MLADFNNFCIITINHLRIRYEQNFPPHLNFVAALPCKTNISMNMNVTTAFFSQRLLWYPTNFAQQRDHQEGRSRYENKRCIQSWCSFSEETAARDSLCFREEFYLPACTCTSSSWNSAASASRNTGLHFSRLVDGTEWPIMCWCAVKKLLTHSRLVASKQSRSQFSWIWDLGCDAALSLQDEN